MKKIIVIIWLLLTIGFSIVFANGVRESYVRSFCSTPIGPYGLNHIKLYSKERRQIMPNIDWWDDWQLREHVSTEFYFQFVMQTFLLMALCYSIPLGFYKIFIENK